jgi:hypothetical protein
MKTSSFCLAAALCLLCSTAAFADITLYNNCTDTHQSTICLNGAPDGLGLIWNTVANSFTLESDSVLTGAEIGVFAHPSLPESVDWSVWKWDSSLPTATAQVIGTGTASLTGASYQYTNGLGYYVYTSTFSLGSIDAAAGAYWFVLSNQGSGPELYWVINGSWTDPGGPSECIFWNGGGRGNNPSEAFRIMGRTVGAVPEPASLIQLALMVGVCLAAGMLKYRSRDELRNAGDCPALR